MILKFIIQNPKRHADSVKTLMNIKGATKQGQPRLKIFSLHVKTHINTQPLNHLRVVKWNKSFEIGLMEETTMKLFLGLISVAKGD